VRRAGIAYRYLADGDAVAPVVDLRAGIDGVLVVDAAADGVALNDLETHGRMSCPVSRDLLFGFRWRRLDGGGE
jgi:hypothetical protein